MKRIKLKESDLERIIRKVISEDAGMDTPGGNPEYFYGDDSLDKLRKFAEEQDSEMSQEDIIQELVLRIREVNNEKSNLYFKHLAAPPYFERPSKSHIQTNSKM